MKLSLNEHYSYGKLLRFTFPTILVLVFGSIYGVVDGFFLSNYAGKMPFAAVNFIMPFTMILSSLGYMMGTGSSALIGKTMGQGQPELARKQFTGLFITTIIIGLLTALLGMALLHPVLDILGCTAQMRPFAYNYAQILLSFLPFAMIQMYFQTIFVTAARPALNFIVALGAGMLNMVLDWLMIGVLDWGVAGAAIATGLGQTLAAVCSMICFLKPLAGKDENALYFTQFKLKAREVMEAMSNGMSEFFTSAASAIISILYNFQLLRLAGENGVAAYGTLMYVSMIFMAISIGYSAGVSPLISYQYGAGNRKELSSLTKKSLVIISIGAVAMFGLAEVLAQPLSSLFAGYDPELMELTISAFRICSPVFLFSGFAIFGSSFFTALNNGPISAAISLIRTVGFQIGFVLVFPALWGLNGVWASMVAAEVMAVLITFILLYRCRKRYGYFEYGWKLQFA